MIDASYGSSRGALLGDFLSEAVSIDYMFSGMLKGISDSDEMDTPSTALAGKDIDSSVNEKSNPNTAKKEASKVLINDLNFYFY